MSSGSETEAGDAPGPQQEVSIWQYLTFLLGLVPVVIAILRVVLTAQGDDATFYTLVHTLNVPALVIATYGRFIGVLGVGVTLPLLLYSRGKNSTGARPVKFSPLARIILWILLGCSIACIYPEEIFDYTVISFWPVDIFRALSWALAVYLPAYLWHRWQTGQLDRAPKIFSFTKKKFPLMAGRLGRAAESITNHRVETLVIAPALALLLWTYLLGNDRMWLPAQVVTVRPAVAVTVDAPSFAHKPSDLDLHTELLPNGDWAFVAYILDQDSSGSTIMTVYGRIIYIPAADLIGQVPCQLEPDYDPGYDRPLLFLVPGHGGIPPNSNQTCLDMMKALKSQ